MLSQGVPMIVMGDEVAPDPARQQQRLLPGQRDHLVRLGARRDQRRPAPLLGELIAFRKAHPTLRRARSSPARSTSAASRTSPGTAAGSTRPAGTTRVPGPRLHARRVPDPVCRAATPTDTDIHVMMNMDFERPRLRRPGRRRPALAPGPRHGRAGPDDIASPGHEPAHRRRRLQGRGAQHRGAHLQG